MRKGPYVTGRLMPMVTFIGVVVSALVVGGASANGPAATISFAGGGKLQSDPVPAVTVTLEGAFTPGVAAGRALVENDDGSATATANQEVSIK